MQASRGRLPPGLNAESLPDAVSRGAVLLHDTARNATTCRGRIATPPVGGGKVTSRMFMLMEVSNRFGG